MDTVDTLDRLLELLSAERDEQLPRGMTLEQKAMYFRAFCNVRPPRPVSEEFLALQDSYLSARTVERKTVHVDELPFDQGIALWRGDITRLDADAIMNACNSALLGCFHPLHDCIDNIIHSNAGVQVRLDCDRLMAGRLEPNGQVKVTSAYNLPSRYIFHTVGSIVENGVTETNLKDLRNCYRSCLRKADELGLETLACCCLSTGVYRFPQELAAEVAVGTVKSYLNETHSQLKVVFDVFTEKDRNIYERLLRTAETACV